MRLLAGTRTCWRAEKQLTLKCVVSSSRLRRSGGSKSSGIVSLGSRPNSDRLSGSDKGGSSKPGGVSCREDADGRCVEVDICGLDGDRTDDCLGEAEPRAWSSPIFVDWAEAT